MGKLIFGGFMVQLIRALSFLVNIYMMILFFRIILTWFTGIGRGRLQETLERITDPYLDWFRQFKFLKVGVLDLSPVAALGVLSLLNRILNTLAYHGRISIGIILAMLLQAVWGAVSFVLGFLIIVLILHLVAHLLGQNSYNPFWRVIATIADPVLFRINRSIFKNRIVNFTAGVVISIAALVLIYLGMRILVVIVSGMLGRLPL